MASDPTTCPDCKRSPACRSRMVLDMPDYHRMNDDVIADCHRATVARAERAEAEREYWRVKAEAYGNIVCGCAPALARAGYPVDAEQAGGAVASIRQAVSGLTTELARALAAEDRLRWRSVKDEPPTVDAYYAVSWECGQPQMGDYDPVERRWYCESPLADVPVWWLPLPPPPEAKP